MSFKQPQTPREAISKALLQQLSTAQKRLIRKVQGISYEYSLDKETNQVFIYLDNELIDSVKLD